MERFIDRTFWRFNGDTFGECHDRGAAQGQTIAHAGRTTCACAARHHRCSCLCWYHDADACRCVQHRRDDSAEAHTIRRARRWIRQGGGVWQGPVRRVVVRWHTADPEGHHVRRKRALSARGCDRCAPGRVHGLDQDHTAHSNSDVEQITQAVAHGVQIVPGQRGEIVGRGAADGRRTATTLRA